MSTPDFSTAENNQELANEVTCLKALLTLMLQAMGQADAGRVILKMEKQIALVEDDAQAAVFSSTVKQIKQVSDKAGRRGIARNLRLIRRVKLLLHILLVKVNGIF